jgi:hypothetical protein
MRGVAEWRQRRRPLALSLHWTLAGAARRGLEAQPNGPSLSPCSGNGSGEPEEALQSYRRVREQQRGLGDRKGDARTREAVVEAGLATGLAPPRLPIASSASSTA